MTALLPTAVVADTRRQFLARTSLGLGAAALQALSLGGSAGRASAASDVSGGPAGGLHFTPRAKRVIYLFQSGGPSQLELLDPKPGLDALFDADLPDSVRQGQRLTGMVTAQKRLPVAPSRYGFQRCGQCGTPIGDLLPYTQRIADEICVINSLHTEAINHDPAITFLQTGSQQPGRPSMGSWVDYGLGAEGDDLPAFVVLLSLPSNGAPDQGLLSRLWGSGFLPSRHQGVKLRSAGEPVLFLRDPEGLSPATRRRWLDSLSKLNRRRYEVVGDPEIEARIAQYEMACRMQTSVPELIDFSDESEATFALYGAEARKPGSFAANCLLARRLAERGVRFIQLYHRGWDHHGDLPAKIEALARDVDQPSAALVLDLKQRGLLDDTLVIWGGEFGRAVYCQGDLSRENYGRDHHGRAFSAWMAGGGIKPGIRYGRTDDFSFNVVENPVHVHDLQATILHCLGVDHERLTFRFQGRQYRLTDVHGRVVSDVLA
ncbi:MAG: sulfatase [Planctomycetota bacterium]|nr:MAG: sulfatase [Planctomycetota bacterium]